MKASVSLALGNNQAFTTQRMINFLSSTNFTLDYKEIAIWNDNKFLQDSSSHGNLCLLKHTHIHTH
jgi:hypothetical protein